MPTRMFRRQDKGGIVEMDVSDAMKMWDKRIDALAESLEPIIKANKFAVRELEMKKLGDGLEPFHEDHVCPKCTSEEAEMTHCLNCDGKIWPHLRYGIEAVQVDCKKCGAHICNMRPADWEGGDNE